MPQKQWIADRRAIKDVVYCWNAQLVHLHEHHVIRKSCGMHT